MTERPSPQDFDAIRAGFDPDPARSLSLRKEAYVDPAWYRADLDAILSRTWQWVCHVEKLRAPGSYVTTEIAGHPIAILRGKDGALRGFYNV